MRRKYQLFCSFLHKRGKEHGLQDSIIIVAHELFYLLLLYFPGMPSLGSFMVPHSLALDRTQQRLFIADRENGRVQVMNSKSGAFIDEIKFPEFGGLVYAVDYSYGERKLLFPSLHCV